ncbi:MAG: VOC family protein [Pirellulaceae bacterium]|nr:VOC family protein [Pirellulaceae bacterium]
MPVTPYLNFDGRCEEALHFYQQAVGAEIIDLMKFSDSPEPCPEGVLPPGTEHKVMHASFRIGGTVLMASDCNCTGKPGFQGFSLTVTVATAAEVDRLLAALADGGKVDMPAAQTFFSPRFGTVTDRFGISWMVLVYGH